MRLTLTREPADGNTVRGFITPIRIPTLENLQYIIPPGLYTLTVTYSPRFKRPLPLVCDVIGAPDDPNRPRSGIRFHRGSKPEHSKGCILLSVADEQHLTALLTNQTSTLTIV